jgi:hypothetical protein
MSQSKKSLADLPCILSFRATSKKAEEAGAVSMSWTVFASFSTPWKPLLRSRYAADPCAALTDDYFERALSSIDLTLPSHPTFAGVTMRGLAAGIVAHLPKCHVKQCHDCINAIDGECLAVAPYLLDQSDP